MLRTAAEVSTQQAPECLAALLLDGNRDKAYDSKILTLIVFQNRQVGLRAAPEAVGPDSFELQPSSGLNVLTAQQQRQQQRSCSSTPAPRFLQALARVVSQGARIAFAAWLQPWHVRMHFKGCRESSCITCNDLM